MHSAKFFVVTGMHRSGTTFMGRLFSQYNHLHVIHEPLNKEFGLKHVNHIYPCDLMKEQAEYYQPLLKRMLESRADFVRYAAKDAFAKRFARRLIGGRTGYNATVLKWKNIYRRTPVTPVLKDPFQILLTQSSVDSGHNVLIIIRHPAAIWLSIKRMDWKFDFEHFADQRILPQLGISLSIDELNLLPEIEKFSWLWTILYSYVKQLNSHKNLHIMKHEDFCFDPFQELKKIEQFLELKTNPEVIDFIEKNMFGKKNDPKEKTQHVFERDSRYLATSWIDKISPTDEQSIKNICGETVKHYYDAWYPREN